MKASKNFTITFLDLYDRQSANAVTPSTVVNKKLGLDDDPKMPCQGSA